jgi:hypothetical protein
MNRSTTGAPNTGDRTLSGIPNSGGKVCAVCGAVLEHKYIQSRSDDEPATLVVKCPVHGIYHDFCARYRELELDRTRVIGSVGPERFMITPQSDCDLLDGLCESPNTSFVAQAPKVPYFYDNQFQSEPSCT